MVNAANANVIVSSICNEMSSFYIRDIDTLFIKYILYFDLENR